MLLKNFRARGLDEKYIGVNGSSCEIESFISKKKKVVHGNNLKRFSVDYEIDKVHEQNEDLASSESETEELVELWSPVQNLNDQGNDDVEVVQERYNLRRDRQAPERYGISVNY